MLIPHQQAIHLLHSVAHGALATHSAHYPGYPFATALPFVADPWQRPVILISGLAEHTRNLQGDPRASLLVGPPPGVDPQTGARMTLVGDTRPFDAEPGLVRRYLRYLPDAERYLELGDFRFYRMETRDIRLIAGFGRMGWTGPRDTGIDSHLTHDDEENLLTIFADTAATRLLGIDPWGIDLAVAGQRERREFPGHTPLPALEEAVANALALR